MAEVLQLWVVGLAWPLLDALVQHAPPNLPAGRVLMASQPPLPPPRWPHLFLGGLPPPLYSSTWSRKASSLSILAGGGYSACTVQVPYPGPLS